MPASAPCSTCFAMSLHALATETNSEAGISELLFAQSEIYFVKVVPCDINGFL
jgi:hypothetical protein